MIMLRRHSVSLSPWVTLTFLIMMQATSLIVPTVSAAEITDANVIKILTTEQPRDRAIRRGLEFLRTLQHAEGYVGDHTRTALTSMAVMAHLAAGITPDDPEYGVWMQRSLRYVLSQQDGDGYFGSHDGSRMYGHGIATLMLAEILGMSHDEELEEKVRASLERAIAITMNAARVQKSDQHRGGWRYQPTDNASDLSLSGWQLMSLHATQQVGITVPEAVIKGAVDYAKRLTSEDGKVGYENRNEDHPALRGLALMSFMVGGQQAAPEIQRIVTRIKADPISWQGNWFFYRVYYDAVGVACAAPEQWETYGQLLEKILIDHQNQNGEWSAPPNGNENDHGPVYRTSLALLALTVNRHVLPAYQR
jgi:hypothetical protein